MAEAKKTSTAITKSLGASLAIQSVSELMQLANVLYLGGANQIPGCGRAEAVAHVILSGAEVGLSPTAALSTIMLVGGKTTVYGDGALALVYASGLMEDFKEWSDGEGDALTYHCRVQRKGEPEPIIRKFSVADAKKADLWEGGSKKKDNWIKYGKRMMTMRARGFALRDKFPDVLKGLHIWEEVADAGADASVVNTEVRVVSAVADAPAVQPAGQQPAPASPPTPTTPTAPALPLDGPITDAQKAELFRLHGLMMAAKGLTDKTAQRSAWEQALAPYGVSSMKEMTAAVAQRACEEIGAQHDPFTYGQKTAPPLTSAA